MLEKGKLPVMFRKPYPTDVSDKGWNFALPNLAPLKTAAPQRQHALGEVFKALCWLVRAEAPCHTIYPLGKQSINQPVAVCRLAALKRWRGSKVHMAVDTLGHLLTLHVTAADAQEHARCVTKKGFVLLPRR